MTSDSGMDDLDTKGPGEPPPRPNRPTAGARPGLTGRALGGMFWTFSGTGVQAAVQLVAIMALGRLLTPTEFGLMSAASVVVAFSQIVSQIGVGPAIIQRKKLETVHIRVAVTLSMVLGGLLGAAVFFGAPAIAKAYHIPELEPILRGRRLPLPARRAQHGREVPPHPTAAFPAVHRPGRRQLHRRVRLRRPWCWHGSGSGSGRW